MNKFQPVSYRSVNDLLDALEGTEKQVTERLREIIHTHCPDLREYLSYQVPFYKRRKRVCYIWPASVPWGGLRPGDGVAIGFCQGHLLQHGGYLEAGSRKFVAQRIFRSLREIDEMMLAGLLEEACRIDAEI